MTDDTNQLCVHLRIAMTRYYWNNVLHIVVIETDVSVSVTSV